MGNNDVIAKEEEILESIKEEEKKERELLEKIEREEEKIELEEESIRKIEEKIEGEIDKAKGTNQTALVRWKQEIWDGCKYKSEKFSEREVAFICNKTNNACTYKNCPLVE
ncbi:hypothetical protein JXA85_08730 [Candidatus Woesearchaeota archaeon]|nr:hypothetical protein [Candidatus Woesearchaeota archaeon]